MFTHRDGVCLATSATNSASRPGRDRAALCTGRASSYDLTDEAKRDYWVDYLIEYTNRPEPPVALVVDGITAILGNDTNRYGAFTSALGSLRVRRHPERPRGHAHPRWAPASILR